MYERHFQFTERPFAAAPQTASYVPAANIEHARQSLIRCAERAEGIGLAIGSAGTGKSLLCQLLAEHFRPGPFQVAVLDCARLHTRRSLLQNILFELHLPYRGMEDEELRLSLLDHLAPRGGGGGLVLIVDEAHTLPPRLLEEVRLISNFVKDGQPRVRLVLVGSPAMEERLAHPKLESLAQRIAARCYLAPLTREETSQYVRRQIERAGGQPERLCPEPVMRAIHQATDGIPRLINQVCDHALILAAIDGQAQLTERRIEEAWADLQQLPTPWQQTAKSDAAAQANAAIEFGQLGDDDGPASISFEPPAADATAREALAGLSQIGDAVQSLAQEEMRPQPLESPAVDPFGSGFDEEEIVIDRYATLGASALSPRAKVASLEGQILGRALRGAAVGGRGRESISADDLSIHNADWPQLTPDPLIDSEMPTVLMDRPLASIERSLRAEKMAVESEPCGTGECDDENPANDPVLPDPVEAAAEPAVEPFVPRSLDHAHDDDRDLIVVQDAVVRERLIAASPETRRRQYRRLFSSLRRP